jgi:hypothetical protein
LDGLDAGQHALRAIKPFEQFAQKELAVHHHQFFVLICFRAQKPDHFAFENSCMRLFMPSRT